MYMHVVHSCRLRHSYRLVDIVFSISCHVKALSSNLAVYVVVTWVSAAF